jgi:glutamyl-tRNA synthetase
MSKPVRVRFAPSPTGPLHIGGVRTALFNYLFAKKHSGTFILRIEDTDQTRFVPGAEEYIIDALNWLSLNIDEGPGIGGDFGPYRQSERKELYKQYALKLVETGWAYYAFDTASELDQYRKEEAAGGNTFVYNWKNRGGLDNSLALTKEELSEKLATTENFVIRFKWPENETLEFQDIIRGDLRISTNTLDDKVLFKSDGMPTYHLANVVDDHLMAISHVIRGEEWLPSLALHVMMYRAFGWDQPEYAHLPLILKPTGKGKLSKRDGEQMGFPIFPLQWKESKGYKEEGFFPEAVVNFLALLGWNPGTEAEMFQLKELISLFDLSRVHKAGARFDPEKNKWYNHQYIITKPLKEIVSSFSENLIAGDIRHNYTENQLTKIAELLRERVNFVTELIPLSSYFFKAPSDFDEKAVLKHWKTATSDIMEGLYIQLESASIFTSAELEAKVKQWIETSGLTFGQVMPPLRLLLVGSLQGPHLFDILELLGKTETLKRIKEGINTLSN